MSAVFELEPSEIEKLMNKFPKAKFKLEKKHVSNINEISDFILTEFECEICKNIPVDPVECDRCGQIFCTACHELFKDVIPQAEANKIKCPTYHKFCKPIPVNQKIMNGIFKKIKFKHTCSIKEQETKLKEVPEKKVNNKRATRTQKQKEKEAEKLSRIEQKQAQAQEKEYTYCEMIDFFKSGCPCQEQATMSCKYYQCQPDKKFTRQEYKDHITKECQGVLLRCKVCKRKILRKDTDKHKTMDCIDEINKKIKVAQEETNIMKGDIRELRYAKQRDQYSQSNSHYALNRVISRIREREQQRVSERDRNERRNERLESMQEASRTFNFQFGREGGSSFGGDPPAEIQRMIQRIFDRDRPENQNPF